MADDQKPRSIAEHKRNAEADATLNQMFDYFTRDGASRQVVTDLEARKVA